jgi:uncharacterized iron-regulated protein
VRIVDARSGEEVSFEAMIDDLSDARVVYVGESHDQPEHHAVQHAIARALTAGDAASWSLGMEMFQRPFQSALDAWTAGSIDPATLLTETEWRERWSFDFELYRPLLELARDRSMRVVALNARRELTRAIARHGVDMLPEELAAELPELDLEVARHHALVEEALGEHADSMGPERLARMYQAQVTWDETMATTVSEVLEGTPGTRMIVLAGVLHVWGGLGIPDRAARRGAAPYRTVLPVADGSEEASFDGPASERPADYLWVLAVGEDG